MEGRVSQLVDELAAIVGAGGDVLPADFADGVYLHDETASRGIRGTAEAVVLPLDTATVSKVLAWCDANRVPLTVRGGGTGLAGGAVPDGGIVLSLERMDRVRSFEPEWWRMEVEAGVSTAAARGLAAGAGLYLPPDPGAAGRSMIGGNVATNAAGPHSFKYGPFGNWVTGIEAVLPSGDVLRTGGSVRKDVAGLDLSSLLTGSEGTLAVITAVSLRLIPMPAGRLPAVFGFPAARSGSAALAACLSAGVLPAAIEFLDRPTLAAAGGGLAEIDPGLASMADAGFMLVVEVDGGEDEATSQRERLVRTVSPTAGAAWTPLDLEPIGAFWRWRAGVAGRVSAIEGGKAGDDIAVPVERLGEAIDTIHAIAAAEGLRACCWGHAGDGNIHANLLVGPGTDPARLAVASDAILSLAISLGGTITGEHGTGLTKRVHLSEQLGEAAMHVNRRIKLAFDPNNTLGPGKS